ncbi:DNA-binding NarL/FixJ family response regulator [Dyadobacter jejuensis]|uniref:DNA-binding NarL/FixJ family response regulator n=1 Tax=Dyadobacter jejuensis TaxID=1082580 RepID=A0A316AC20_9BACT|nr:response regulator transcription factor [Dyadobacter jejuensis]PWJ55326.1 DNA-binding NarL/FixJ family response regulator [Dyadobacter jejuensis]
MTEVLSHHNIKVIAIIDSRPMFREGVKASLMCLHGSFEILESKTCQELEMLYPGIYPDIILMAGQGISDLEIFSTCSQLMQYCPSSRVVIYDNNRSKDFIILCLKNRVRGFLYESFHQKDLEACLTALAKGIPYVNSDLAYLLIIEDLERQKRLKKLFTKMEAEVATHLISGLSTSQIAKELNRRSSTISTTKSNIFRKAKVHNIIDLARVLVSKRY